MNPDSRKRGKGKPKPKRRIVKPRSVRESAFIQPAQPELKSSELLAKVRAQALSGLSDLVALSLSALRQNLEDGPERNQTSRSLDARYVLDAVLDRVSAPAALAEDAEVDEQGNAAPTPVDELAVRRAELQKLLRQQRKDADRDKYRSR